MALLLCVKIETFIPYQSFIYLIESKHKMVWQLYIVHYLQLCDATFLYKNNANVLFVFFIQLLQIGYIARNRFKFNTCIHQACNQDPMLDNAVFSLLSLTKKTAVPGHQFMAIRKIVQMGRLIMSAQLSRHRLRTTLHSQRGDTRKRVKENTKI